MKQLAFLSFIFSFLFCNPLQGQHYFSIGLDNMFMTDEYRIYPPDPVDVGFLFDRFHEKYVFSGIEMGYHFNSRKNVYLRFNTSFYWKINAKDEVETFSSFIHANKIKVQIGKGIRIKKHRLGLGGEFYLFNSKTLNNDYGFSPVIDYAVPLKKNMNLRVYANYALDLQHFCVSCDESRPRSFAYHFGVLLDLDFRKRGVD